VEDLESCLAIAATRREVQDHELHGALAAAHLASGDGARALHHADVAIADRGVASAAHAIRIEALLQDGRVDEAAAAAAEALAAADDSALAGLAHLPAAFVDRAAEATVIEVASALLDRMPDHGPSLWARGKARAVEGAADEALRDLEACRAVADDEPFLADLYDALAELHLAGQRADTAQQRAAAALSIDPTRGPSVELLVLAALAANHVDAAVEALRRRLSDSRGREPLQYAYLLRELLDVDAPEPAADLAALATTSCGRGRAPRAVRSLAGAMAGGDPPAKPAGLGADLGPMHTLVRCRVEALYRCGRNDEAATVLRGLLTASTARDLEPVVDLLFETHTAEDWDHVVELAELALQRLPEHAECLWLLGSARAALGQIEQAVEDLEAFIEAEPAVEAELDEDAHTLLAELHLRQGEFERVIEHVDAAPDTPSTVGRQLQLKVQALLAGGDADGAIAALSDGAESLPARAVPPLLWLLHATAEQAAGPAVLDLTEQLLVRLAEGGAGVGSLAAAVLGAPGSDALDSAPLGEHAEPMVTLLRHHLHLLVGAGQTDEAATRLRGALAGLHTNDLAIADALALELADGLPPAAILDVAATLLQRRPDHAGALWLRARAHQESGDTPAAVEDLHQCVRSAGDDFFAPDAHVRLAGLQLDAGEPAEALALADVTLQYEDHTPTRAHEIRACSLVALDRPDEAAEAARSCLASAPDAWVLDLAYLYQLVLEAGRARAANEGVLDLTSRLAGADVEPAVTSLSQVLAGGSAAPIPGLGGHRASALILARTRLAALCAGGRSPEAQHLLSTLLDCAHDDDLSAIADLFGAIPWPDDEAAADAASAVLERAPGHQATLRFARGARRALAERSHALADHDAVLRHARASLQLGDGSTRDHELIAQSALALGREDAACEAIRAGIERGAARGEVNLVYLLQPLAELGDLEGVVTCAGQLLGASGSVGEEDQPDRTDLAIRQVDALLGLERTDQALAALADALTALDVPGREVLAGRHDALPWPDDGARADAARAVLARLPDHEAALAFLRAHLGENAERAHAAGEHEAVLGHAGEALQHGVAGTRCHELMAQAAVALERPAEALEAIQAGIARAADLGELNLAYLVHTQLDLGDREAAIDSAGQLLQAAARTGARPADAAVDMLGRLLVTTLLELGRDDDAVAALDDLAWLDEDQRAPLQGLLAERHHALDAAPAALEHADAALALADTPPSRMLEIRALALLDLGRPDEAARAIRACIATSEPDLAFDRTYLVQRLFDAGELDLARPLARGVLQRGAAEGAPPAIRAACLALTGEGGAPAAEPLQRHLDAVVTLARARIGDLYTRSQADRARAALLGLLEGLHDDDMDAAADLVFQAHLHNDGPTVLDATGAILARAPQQAYGLWIRGAALGKMGEGDAARECLQACLDAPAGARSGFEDAVFDTLAEVCLQLDDLEGAITHATEALAIAPGKPESEHTLGLARHRQAGAGTKSTRAKKARAKSRTRARSKK